MGYTLPHGSHPQRFPCQPLATASRANSQQSCGFRRQPGQLSPYLPPVLGVRPAVRGVWLVPSLLPGPALAAAAVAEMRGVPVSCPWSRAVLSLLAGQPGVLPAAVALLAALPAAAWPPALWVCEGL